MISRAHAACGTLVAPASLLIYFQEEKNAGPKS